jgi:hypothetical protein
MHKMEFGQAYCQYLLTMIPRKFILYFSESPMNLYEFGKFTRTSGIFNSKKKFENGKKPEQWWS